MPTNYIIEAQLPDAAQPLPPEQVVEELENLGARHDGGDLDLDGELVARFVMRSDAKLEDVRRDAYEAAQRGMLRSPISTWCSVEVRPVP